MSDEMNQKMAKLLEYIQSGAERIDGFVVDQAPRVAQEIVTWQMWSSAITLVAVSIPCSITAAWLVRLGVRLHKNETRDSELRDSTLAFFVAALIGGFVLAFGTTMAHQIVKCHIAPRIVVLDYCRNVLK